MTFDFRHLETFLAVVETQSFTGAAKRIGVSQPTVSTTISQLERECGTPLFDRLGRRVQPTHAGRTLLAHAQRLIDAREEAVDALQRVAGLTQGSITVCCSTVPGEYLLPRYLAPFCQSYPGVQVRVEVRDSGGVVDAVLEGRCDMGICGSVPEAQELVLTPLWPDQLVLAMRSDHPYAQREALEARDLLELPYVSRGAGSGTQRLVEQCLRAANVDFAAITKVASLGSTAAVKESILSGVGVSLLSEAAVQRERRSGLLATVRLKDCELIRHFNLIHHPRVARSPAVEALRALLLEAKAG